jgi:uncharacterized membrane protein (UPF0127 family)
MGMTRRAIYWFLGLTLLAGACSEPTPAAQEMATLTVETRSAKHRFSVEMARTREAQARGLMYRRTLAPETGMLFVYPREQTLSMWMKNTYLPLDMLFIRSDGRIAHIVERTVPLSTAFIGSKAPVRAVLELNGGTVDRLGIKTGDRVVHPVFESR